jgi:uncharacterized Tic20 family protein
MEAPVTETPPPPDTGGQNWAVLCHLAALLGLLGGLMSIPFGNLLGPLVVWLLKKKEFPLVDQQGKESLNFQLSMTIYAALSALLIFVGIGIVLLAIIIVVDVVLVIVASVKTSNGKPYRYPLTIRLFK